MRKRAVQNWCRTTLRAGAIGAAVAFGTTALSGCAVDTKDIHRWETTVNGPDKLAAVITHDKYARPLRAEAALSLIRMKPRQGQHVGLEKLQTALTSLGSTKIEARRQIIADITPEIVKEMAKPGPKPKDGVIGPDPTIAFKDAAYALYQGDQNQLADDPKSREELAAALTEWVQSDFESRIDRGGQTFGVETIMRALGPRSVRKLPESIRADSPKLDRMIALIADIGEPETKRRAGEALVAAARAVAASEWIEKQRPIVEESNKRNKREATKQQVDEQLKKYQESELEKLFATVRRLGGRAVVDFCLTYARDGKNPEPLRERALQALQNHVHKSPTPGAKSDGDRLVEIIKDEKATDKLRAMALARIAELPKAQFIPLLLSTFDVKKWQVRLEAAKLVLGAMELNEVPEFMKRLPAKDDIKMGMPEGIAYGYIISQKQPAGGVKPREFLDKYLEDKAIGPKLVAIGSYYGVKKSEASALDKLKKDNSKVSKCEPADDCKWVCEAPKSDKGKETEQKPVTNVAEFTEYCIMTSLTSG